MRALVAAALVVALVPASPGRAASPGLHVDGTRVLQSDGTPLLMRGINHGHAWFPDQTEAFGQIAAAGANTIRVVLSGGRYGVTNGVADVAAVADRCRALRVVCVLEDHDTTGWGSDSTAFTLQQAAAYWVSVRSALRGREAWVAVNLGNEPVGNAQQSSWTGSTQAAIRTVRKAGIRNLLVVDAPDYGADVSGVMRTSAPAVFAADVLGNTVFSVHMYGSYSSAAVVADYLDAFARLRLPLIVGEFAWQALPYGDPDEDAILRLTRERSVGWLAWSWSGNSGGTEYMDLVARFRPELRLPWGDRVVAGPDGLRETSRPLRPW